MTGPYLRLIGDVHGKMEEYIPLAEQAEYTIQLGDLGFSYNALSKFLNPDKHRVLGGNHDNYEVLDGRFHKQPPHFLGDYGVHNIPGIGEFFFVRGGNSIDKAGRTEGFDWFPGEQLSYVDAAKAIEEYTKVRPALMLSHECPTSIIDILAGFKTWDGELIRPSMTANVLEQMFEEHKPLLWVFGHHHKHFNMVVEGTRFICLPELACLDFDRKEAE